MSKYIIFCIGLYLLICFQVVLSKNKKADPRTKQSLVEVRAVFINCESDSRQDNLDSPILRFERQELFKHNALRGCNKKLALTLKIASPDPTAAETDAKDELGEEYIPIDHVLEGSERKRVRLLNPYILRLHREMPKQAYKLRRIDTVSGVLTRTDLTGYSDNSVNSTIKRQVNNRERRELDASEQMDEKAVLLGSASSVITLEHENPSHHSYSVRIGRLQELLKTDAPAQLQEHATQDCGLRLFSTPPIRRSHNVKPLRNQKKKSIVLYDSDVIKGKRGVCPKTNSSSLGRVKRQNQIMMTMMDETIVTPRHIKGRHHHPTYEGDNQNRNMGIQDSHTEEDIWGFSKGKFRHGNPRPKDKMRHSETHTPSGKLAKHTEKVDSTGNIEGSFSRPEGEFALYEIGDPNLWYDITVHLFEKLSTSEGKTVWNDLTQGVDARVSSANPEWKGQDVNVRYKPAEWVPRDDFLLPTSRLCLLEPLRDNDTLFEDEPQQLNPASQNYIVVPIEDVIYVNGNLNLKKRHENGSSATANDTSDPNNQKQPRRVEVRVSRAIMGSGADNFDIAHLGADRFLTLPHRRPHHSQIDVEVRADDNVLVRVGSSGRLATVVTDNTRKKRTTVYFQATNTGLASARFKAVIRECGPELSIQMKEKGSEEISSEPILLAPYHTRRMKLEVPAEIPTDIAHCNVALVNDEDESIAVRDFSIKKGDRCFCVWHCECVCLGDDPKLLCREMSQPQQVAAGLALSQRPRHARSICYKDNMALDFISVLLSIIIFLLFLGFIKAFVGLWNVWTGQLGWDRVLGTPRIIPCYFEPCLRNRTVVYRDGWPVHPDTNKRCVRVLSCPASFLLNLVFFIILPCLAIYGSFRACVLYSGRCLKSTSCKIRKNKQIFSAHDLQSESLELLVRRKKKNKLSDWMTPVAEQLTADVITSSMEPALAKCQMNEMQPLLLKTNLCNSDGGGGGAMSAVPDSEQEDTDYVLMQMQKSRESLARSIAYNNVNTSK